MKKLIILLLLFSFSSIYSQQIVQTYTDRCTKATYTFVVAYNSSTVVTFYDRSRVFTATEFTNGTLQQWLEDTYQWWKNLSPCSANQSNSTNTTNTTSNATSSSNTASGNATGSSGSSGDSGGGSGDSGGGSDDIPAWVEELKTTFRETKDVYMDGGKVTSVIKSRVSKVGSNTYMI